LGTNATLPTESALMALTLHVGGAARLLGLDALVLRLALHLEGFHFLVRDFALREHRDQCGGVDHVLDVDAAGFDFVLGELALDVGEGLFLHVWRVWMNLMASMPPILSRKRLPTAACRTSFTRFSMEPTMEMTRGALVSGTWMRTWRSMAEDEAFIAFGDDGFEARVEAVGSGDVLGPIELEDGGENELGVVDAGIDGILAGAQRLLPDALMAGAHQSCRI
jgi:hypothetical protein